MPRTALTSVDVAPIQSKKADVRAPLEASFSTHQSYAQHAAFVQWHRFDLAGGARPFLIDLWLWDRVRRVRVRLLGAWQAQRELYDSYELSGTFEIERESIK